jgi:hypothetical protein
MFLNKTLLVGVIKEEPNFITQSLAILNLDLMDGSPYYEIKVYDDQCDYVKKKLKKGDRIIVICKLVHGNGNTYELILDSKMGGRIALPREQYENFILSVFQKRNLIN